MQNSCQDCTEIVGGEEVKKAKKKYFCLLKVVYKVNATSKDIKVDKSLKRFTPLCKNIKFKRPAHFYCREPHRIDQN